MPLDDPSYDYLERLVDLGLAPATMQGTRPITIAYALEIVRQASQTAAQRGEAEPPFLETLRGLLDRLQPHEGGPTRLGGAAQLALGTRHEVATPLSDSHGQTAGQLTSGRGRYLHAADGMALGATARSTIGRWAAGELAVDLDFPDGRARASLRRGYVKVGWGALELVGGRDALVWGHAGYASLMLSGHAQAFDQVRLQTSQPVILPWIFRYLGRIQGVLFLARLEQTAPARNPYAIGKRLAIKPVSWLELGVSHVFAFGGEGAPPFPADKFVEEFLFGYRRDVWGENLANNGFAWDFRVRLGGAVEIYGEHYLEDCCSRLWTRDSSALIGVRRPRLTSWHDDLAVELAYLSWIAYVHEWTPEWQHRGRILGHPLGNRGVGAYALWRYLDDAGGVVRLRLGLEHRGVPDDDPRPAEWRISGHATVRLPLTGGGRGRVDALARGSIERVLDAWHVTDTDRTAALVEIGLEAAF